MRIDDLNEYMNFEIVGQKKGKKEKWKCFFFKQFLSEIIFVAYIKKNCIFSPQLRVLEKTKFDRNTMIYFQIKKKVAKKKYKT